MRGARRPLQRDSQWAVLGRRSQSAGTATATTARPVLCTAKSAEADDRIPLQIINDANVGSTR